VIEPYARDEQFLAALEEPDATPDELRLWWLGQSGFLLRWNGRRVVLDPYLSDSLTHKYATTDKPHVRMTTRVIAPERLNGIDVVTSSHNHTDHLDAETLIPLRKANPDFRLIIPAANRDFVQQRLGDAMGDPVLLDDGQSAQVAGMTFHGIAAAHNKAERDEQACCRFLGYVLQAGPWTIYHSGDTLLYPGLAAKLRPLGPIDLALLPINGNRPERRVAGNFDGREAATLAHEIGARCAVPCHYEMFAFNTADPGELFVPACRELGQPCRVLRAGESMRLTSAG
jgi:L-ascorbate metabolism protein UlaG (beta-lactamase superfamily)